jgi:2-iminobutanoate/2-iminopropanoate deaminase
MSDARFFHDAEIENSPKTPISMCAVAGDFVYTWGYGEILHKGREDEGMRKVFEHIKGLLAEQGLVMSDVVKCTSLLTNGVDWDIYTRVYKEYFKAPYPCRTTIPVETKDPIFELDVVAYKKGLSDRK